MDDNLTVANQAVALLNELPEEEQLKIVDYIRNYIEAIKNEQKNEQ